MMLIKEIRDMTKDVPKKTIILDQMGPSDIAELVLQISVYCAIDASRGRLPEDQTVTVEDVEDVLENVQEQITSHISASNIKKLLDNAIKGKL